MEQSLETTSIPNVSDAKDSSKTESCTQQDVLQKVLQDRYCILKQLGQGGQGSVYLAEKKTTHERVAIKQLLIQSIKDWRQYDMFQREANALQRLSIKGVAKLHETMELLNIETPMALIIQDYIDGEPMQKFIAQGHRFRIEQIAAILEQLLDILEQLHQQNPPIIHRDLKPSNIILRYEANSDLPSVHLIDFGAVSNPQLKGGGSTVVGTYGYMAPEQLMGKAEPASDIYSLAIIAVYLMSGVPPEDFVIQDFHVLIEPLLEHLPYEITAVLRQMLEPRIENRLTNTQTIKNFFEAIKNQSFDALSKSAIQSTRTPKDKYSLDKVYSYRQAGNIELWQELSDKTPRKINQTLRSKLTTNKNIFPIIVSSLILLILSNFLLSFFELDLELIILFMIALLISITSIAYIYALNRVRRDANSFQIDQLTFFKQARKSMATVIRIEYIPVSWVNLKAGISFTPSWKIYYSFNPPDDSSPDPLIHCVTTHASVEHLKEGDLIPILYFINRKMVECVYSTPYPIPIQDKYDLYTTFGENDLLDDEQGE